MEMKKERKESTLIGESTEWKVGWRAAAALQGPYFLVLAGFARSLISYPQL